MALNAFNDSLQSSTPYPAPCTPPTQHTYTHTHSLKWLRGYKERWQKNKEKKSGICLGSIQGCVWIMHAVPADGNQTLLSNPIMQSEVIRLPVSEDHPLTVIVLMVVSLSSPQYHDQANHMEAIGARKSRQSPDDLH